MCAAVRMSLPHRLLMSLPGEEILNEPKPIFQYYCSHKVLKKKKLLSLLLETEE